MEKYDVIVIGGGLGSLTTATYLSKRLRNVAVFEQSRGKKLLQYSSKLVDNSGNKYNFNFYNRDMGGVHPGDLFHEYLKKCGLDKKFTYFDNEYAMIVDQNKRIVKRPNNLKDFKIYLVRRYPKLRDDIYALFTNIERHYTDYRAQKLRRLRNEDNTLPSVLIEWGDLSLYDVLNKFFEDENIINEFVLVYDSLGFKPNQINAYNYFIKFFDTFIDGSHFISASYNDVVKSFTNEISKSKEKIFSNRKIVKFIFKDDQIHKVIDSDGIEIQAKHYVINMRIDDFVDEYIPQATNLKEDFLKMYETINENRLINQVYLGLDTPAEDLGITEKQYLFSEFPDDNLRIMSILNYKQIDNDCCDEKHGALLVEFLDDETLRRDKLDQVIDQLCVYFPLIVDHIVAKKIGTSSLLFSGKASDEFWKNKTINDLFDVDDYRTINPFTNGYFIGSWLRPEAGITGIVQTGVEYGDIIDDLIYRGDDDDYFITHDELMMIISNQFIPGALGKSERNIQFFVGKDSYYIRTKAKHQRLYKGVSDISDIIIIATNECLYDLSVGNTTLQRAIEAGSFEYVGDEDLLNEVIEAFDMGILDTSTSSKHTYVPGQFGIKIVMAMFGVLVLSNLLANYHNYLIIAPFTIAFLGAIDYYKYKKLSYISVFDYVVGGMYVAIFFTSIFVRQLNELQDSSYTTMFLALFLLISWLFNKPVLFGYIKFDYRYDYTKTKLFLKMAGGLTFIWGLFFLIVSVLSFRMIDSYSSLGYYISFVAFYLMYYYPTSYITGNIE